MLIACACLQVWEAFDPKGDGVIPAQQLPDLLLCLAPPLGLRGDNEASRSEAARQVRKLQIGGTGLTVDEGEIGFHRVLLSVVQFSFEQKEVDLNNHRVHAVELAISEALGKMVEDEEFHVHRMERVKLEDVAEAASPPPPKPTRAAQKEAALLAYNRNGRSKANGANVSRGALATMPSAPTLPSARPCPPPFTSEAVLPIPVTSSLNEGPLESKPSLKMETGLRPPSSEVSFRGGSISSRLKNKRTPLFSSRRAPSRPYLTPQHPQRHPVSPHLVSLYLSSSHIACRPPGLNLMRPLSNLKQATGGAQVVNVTILVLASQWRR